MSAGQSPISASPYLGGLLVFFVRALRSYLPLVVLLPLAAAVVAFIVAGRIPPAYVAQASIQIGRVDGAQLLDPQIVTSRLNSQAFNQRMLASMMNSPEGSHGRQSVLATLTARPGSAGNVDVVARASDAQQARRALDVTVQLLNEEQEKLAQPLLAGIKEQLASSEAEIASLSRDREKLSTLVKTIEEDPGDAATARFRSAWLMELVSRNDRQLAEARAARSVLASRLGLAKTYLSELLDGAFVSPTELSPHKTLIAGEVAVLTLFICILFALMRYPKSTGQTSVLGHPR
jgi:hypothetical protein